MGIAILQKGKPKHAPGTPELPLDSGEIPEYTPPKKQEGIMAMPLEQEARIWQTIGIVSWAAGAGMLLVLVKQNGVVRVADTTTLSTGIAASFMMLAGIAGTVFGRVMHALTEGYKADEARLWHLFAVLCCANGAFAVLYIAIGHWNTAPSLTSLTVGLAGAFLVMSGVICLLGNRVMDRASQAHASPGSASGKSAGA